MISDFIGYYILIPIALLLLFMLIKNVYDDIKYNLGKGMSFGEALITTPDYYRIEWVQNDK